MVQLRRQCRYGTRPPRPPNSPFYLTRSQLVDPLGRYEGVRDTSAGRKRSPKQIYSHPREAFSAAINLLSLKRPLEGCRNDSAFCNSTPNSLFDSMNRSTKQFAYLSSNMKCCEKRCMRHHYVYNHYEFPFGPRLGFKLYRGW